MQRRKGMEDGCFARLSPAALQRGSPRPLHMLCVFVPECVCVRVCVLAAVERDMLEEDGGELANIDEDEPCPEPIILSVSCLLCAAIAWLCPPVSVQLFTLTSLYSHVIVICPLFALTSSSRACFPFRLRACCCLLFRLSSLSYTARERERERETE